MEALGERKFIVVGMEHYNPLGAIRSLGENGVRPDYIAIAHKCPVASLSKYVNKVHRAGNFEEAYDILVREYGDASAPPFVITTDDDIQSLIDRHYDELKDRLTVFNCGENGRTTRFMNKKEILDCAERHGLPVLRTLVVDRGDIPADLEYPIITKAISPNDGGWKSDVFICKSTDELKEAHAHIQSERVLIQRFVEKDNEICIEGFSVDGGRTAFLPLYVTYNYNIEGYYSPYMTVHSFDLPHLDRGIREMLVEIGFEGIFEIEFLVDRDGAVYFSEINFRNSTWGYASASLGMPLPSLWAQSMLTSSVPAAYYKEVPEGYTAMVEPIDYQKRVVEGETSVGEWLSDFRRADCLYYQNDLDTAPFEAMVENWDLLS